MMNREYFQSQFLKMIGFTFLLEKREFKQVNFSPKIEMNSSVASLFLLPHSSSKLELSMNFNAIFRNVKIIKIGLLDANL